MMMISNPKQNFLVMKLGFVKKNYCIDFENNQGQKSAYFSSVSEFSDRGAAEA
jgi:hypothetical protein